MINHNPKKRKLLLNDDDDHVDDTDDHVDDTGIRKMRKFKVLLPNGTSVGLKILNTENAMHFGEFVGLIRTRYLQVQRKNESMRKKREINWNSGGLFLQDASDNKIKNVVDFKNFIFSKCHILRLNVSIYYKILILNFSVCVIVRSFFSLIFGFIVSQSGWEGRCC